MRSKDLFGKGARVSCGHGIRLEDVRIREVEVLACSAAVVPPGQPAKKFRLSTLLVLTNDLEVMELSDTGVMHSYTCLRRQSIPKSPLQNSCPHCTRCYWARGPFCVDFAVWSPLGHRIAKKERAARHLCWDPQGNRCGAEVCCRSNLPRLGKSAARVVELVLSVCLQVFSARYGHTGLGSLVPGWCEDEAASRLCSESCWAPFDREFPWEWSNRCGKEERQKRGRQGTRRRRQQVLTLRNLRTTVVGAVSYEQARQCDCWRCAGETPKQHTEKCFAQDAASETRPPH